MSYVRVKLLANNRTYSVEVDEDADPKALAQGLARRLDLPQDRRYRLYLVDSLKIHQGATIKMEEIGPEDLFRGLRELEE